MKETVTKTEKEREGVVKEIRIKNWRRWGDHEREHQREKKRSS